MPGKPIKHIKDQPTVALCYIRLSYTRDGKDTASPDRQRSNILRVCDQHGWTPEFYTDTEGHRSGTSEKNRPGWLALKARLADPDIAALVANDLSRLHRKGWRVGDLLDFVDEHHVKLILAAQGKQIDFSTPLGRLMVQVGALFDEWYAQDIGQRSRDSVRHRKSEGKTIGIPPFGTMRDKQGFLIASNAGAWLLVDGTFVKGNADQPPAIDAIWRGFHAAAFRVLEQYASGRIGSDKLAYEMQREGWTYRDRGGHPIPFAGDAIRRIVANWSEYGGHVSELRAKERHPHSYPFENYALNPDRAIFPVDLLYRVGKIRYERTQARVADTGLKRDTYPYPLLGLVYCAHCDQSAEHSSDPKLHLPLGGKGKDDSGRYRHSHRVVCGSRKRSITREILEARFGEVLDRLRLEANVEDVLTDLSIDPGLTAGGVTRHSIEAENRVAIAKCNRRIQAARYLFDEGEMTFEAYARRKEQNEQEIAHRTTRPIEVKSVTTGVMEVLQAGDTIGRLWRECNDEEKQSLAQSLIERVIVDLDAQQISSIQLQPWAEKFFRLLV